MIMEISVLTELDIVFIYLLLKSYSKYKIDRDRNITHGTDINIRKNL